MWCVPKLDAEYVERMEDVLEVYARALDPREPVVCLDEKSVPLRSDARPLQECQPGRIRRRDSEYVRHGTANIFCALEPKAPRRFSRVTPTRSGREFAKMVASLERQYPKAETIHLVMDNLNTHVEKFVTDTYGAKEGARIWERFTIHYTPKHGSWLNQAEIENSLLGRQVLGSRRIPEIRTLRDEVAAWNCYAARHRLTINWRFTKSKARKIFGYNKSEFTRSRD